MRGPDPSASARTRIRLLILAPVGTELLPVLALKYITYRAGSPWKKTSSERNRAEQLPPQEDEYGLQSRLLLQLVQCGEDGFPSTVSTSFHHMAHPANGPSPESSGAEVEGRTFCMQMPANKGSLLFGSCTSQKKPRRNPLLQRGFRSRGAQIRTGDLLLPKRM